MHAVTPISYRNDIDGLRAISVLAVILFHLGYLPNGYLGVDVFFVISGYLITKIIHGEASQNCFSIARFYLRRIRRIIPLVLFTTTTALFIGCMVMLPDDLENLSQSIIATNLFSNNILLFITTGNYWDIVNEYKPLMHTWSLGVEEQFYVLYPIIFLVLNGKRSRHILPVLVLLTVVSLILFVTSNNEASTFYLIHFRFFELSIGGIAAILFKEKGLPAALRFPFALGLLLLFIYNFHLHVNIKLLLVVFATAALLVTSPHKQRLSSYLLENPIMVGLGKISFSLYMWHQIVLAFARYFVYGQIGAKESVILFTITLLLSLFSYFLIEQPFRNPQRISTKTLLSTAGIFFAIVCSASYYLYSIGGIIRDVPELGLYKSNIGINKISRHSNMHNAFNASIYDFDKGFTDTTKTNFLVVGNSFARDFANILLASKALHRIDISYVEHLDACEDIGTRLQDADFVVFTGLSTHSFQVLQQKFHIDTAKVWNVGIKNFGANNGLFFNQKKDSNYCKQRTHLSSNLDYLAINNTLKEQWGKRYIDLLGPIMDKESKVPVFTNDCQFISQDTRHLTKAGAIYYANLLQLHRLFATVH